MTDDLDEPSTLCHCASCEAFRKDIRRGLMEFPTTVKERTVELWLNVKYEDMRKACRNVRGE